MGSDEKILFQKDLIIYLSLENFVQSTRILQDLKLTNYQKIGTQKYSTMSASQNRGGYPRRVKV